MSEKRLVSLWLCSAFLVCVVRFLHATDPGWDLTIQIQAAQNFLKGKGFAAYPIEGGVDLAVPLQLVTLTHFPAGYSLYAAALLAAGLSVATLIKIGGIAATTLGWWGWGRLACPFLRDGLKLGLGWKLVAAAIAILTPLFFTLPWSGTDIFLWAAIPWVLMWVVRAADPGKPGGIRFDLLAGVACGACVFLRYAGVVLALYAGFLIVCQARSNLQKLSARSAVFAAGLFPFLAFQIYLNHFVSTSAAEPGGLRLFPGATRAFATFWSQSSHLTSANYAVVWWLPRMLVKLLLEPIPRAPWLLVLTVAVFALPVLLAQKLRLKGFSAVCRDIRPIAAGLMVAIPFSIWACSFFGVAYLEQRRYYQPLLPLAVLIAYCFAVAGSVENKWASFLRVVGLVYIGGYVCMISWSVALLFQANDRGFDRRAKLIGTRELRPWPSMAMIYKSSAAREYILDLFKQEQGTVLVTDQPQWFYADSEVDLSRVQGLQLMRANYFSGPGRILIWEQAVEPNPAGIYQFRLRDEATWRQYVATIPDLRLIKTFPEENFHVLEARVPAGSKLEIEREPVSRLAQKPSNRR